MIKKLIIYTFLFYMAITVQAENTRFVMSASKAVEMGKQFRLSFTLNARGNNLKLPPGLRDNFDILMGPSTGQSTSIRSTVNGRTTQEVSYSYTYILRAKKEGGFEIRPASIDIRGKVFESNSLKIRVVKPQSKPTQTNTKNLGSTNVDLGKDNMFVRVVLSKQNVFRGEQIIATVKLYVNPNIPIAGFDEVNLPTYEGFYTQDIEIPQQINFTREVYKDKIYQIGILKKTILFPQQNGKIIIEPFSMALLVQQQVKARSFFDDYFSTHRTVKSRMTSSAVTVNVKDLPTQPTYFMGGVGNFNINSSISANEVTTNDAVTLTVKINGTGNIRLIKSPELTLPTDFEVYDPRATDNVKTTANGATGTKTIEYLFQPRFEGDYTIPAIKFAYFNPATGKYITKSTQEYNLHVTKGSEEQSTTVISSLRKEDVRLIGQDIRFIKQGNLLLRIKGYTFFGTTWFYLIYAISTALFIILFIVYRKNAKENANIALVRNKKANRVAKKRLKAAAGFMKQNNNEAFHDEILKAFFGYLSDKLGIPVANLNRESAISKLQERNVTQEVIDDYTEVVDHCEFARYAPTQGSEARSELYKKAEATMSRFEKQIKK
ncbi:MAG: protein BatD [Draconibacterium sp.]|nr:protein BatD [Draconibacterium sp.]